MPKAQLPDEIRFPRTALRDLFIAAQMNNDQCRRFLQELFKHLPRRGPKPKDDDALILRAAELLRDGAPNPHAACKEATKHLPEWERKTAQRRIYKKRQDIVALSKVGKVVPPPPPLTLRSG